MDSELSITNQNLGLPKKKDISKFTKASSNEEKTDLTNYFSTLISLKIAKELGDNLFTATANPEHLMKIRNGVGSAVMGENGITQHAEFVKHGFLGITPILVFQSLSIATGQYYLHNINQNLKSIKDNVESLVLLHKEKDISKMKTIFQGMEELFNNNFYDKHELSLVNQYIDNVRELKNYNLVQMEKTREKLNKMYLDFKKEDYLLQCQDISPNKPWYDIFTSDVISELKFERDSKIRVKERFRRYMDLHNLEDHENKHSQSTEEYKEEILKIKEEYHHKIKALEANFRDVTVLRTQSVIKKRHDQLKKLIEDSDLYHVLNLQTMTEFLEAQLTILKIKILLSLDKDKKVLQDLNSLFEQINQGKLNSLMASTDDFISSFEHYILDYLKADNIDSKFMQPTFDEFINAKQNFIYLNDEIKKQENLINNSKLYFTIKDGEPSYSIINQ